MPKLLCFGLGLLALAPLAACGGGGSDTVDAPLDCSMVTGTDTFVVGLEKKGENGALDFKLMSVDPAPPARNNNTWVVEIDAMTNGVVGAPVDGAMLTVTPFMPAHQHGTPIEVGVTPTGTPGQYTLDPVNLWMPGVWETTIVASQGATTDTAVYSFCIPN